ncbi:MAG: aconitate hydratase [Proteobacteria bacterium]|nr:aconitate hydratase [Pseudomonadota bacterium]
MASPKNLARKLIESHLCAGDMVPGEEIQLAVDQVLLQDATGTLTMLALEAIGLERVRVELCAQYVDHGLMQADFRNPDDHIYLHTAAQRFGIWYSPPGNGISHPVHMERFGVPGKFLLGADSHTPSAGSLGMLGIGAGSIEVATVLAGEPFFISMPEIWGVRLTGRLPDWVSAKDVILEMLRRHTVKGGIGRLVEYYGPGVAGLSAMDRHVIANMGAELGVTTSLFPSDERTRAFLEENGRGDCWIELAADEGAAYDVHDEIDLSRLEPLIATPSSPDNVVPVRDVAGRPVYQSYIGSSANPGYRDFALPALMVRDRKIAPGLSFDVNPSTRQVLTNLTSGGMLTNLIAAGGRIHQAGCNGCMGMGQAPATGRNSLRTVPRNFPGRSGVKEDSVYLCSPETATASAITGRITDPRDLGIPYPRVAYPKDPIILDGMVIQPPGAAEAKDVEIVKGPGIAALPPIEPLGDKIEGPVLLVLGDDVSTDTIIPSGARVMPYRSNVQKISDFCFEQVDGSYVERAKATRTAGGHVIVAGLNYGQGSSREHAVLAPRYLGLKLVIAKGFARIHRGNLINAGVLPLTFAEDADYDLIEAGDAARMTGVLNGVGKPDGLTVRIGAREVPVRLELTPRQADILTAGGLINWLAAKAA